MPVCSQDRAGLKIATYRHQVIGGSVNRGEAEPA